MHKLRSQAVNVQALQRRILIALLVLGATITVCAQRIPALEVGARLDNFQATDVAGKTQSLKQYEGKIVVLFFWSFKCPVSLTYIDRMQALFDKYGNKGVVLLGVDSGINESQEEIRANASNLKITVPILLDTEGDLMDKLETTHTPSVFILDQKAILRYKGAPDNNKAQGEKGRISYMDDAVEALLSGRAISVAETPVFGCSIKRRRIRE
jgi:peroxiredoxin